MLTKKSKKPLYKPAYIGFGLILISILVAITGPIGSRIGWWDFDAAVMIFKWSSYTGLAATILCVFGLVKARPGGNHRGFAVSILGILIITPMILLLLSWKEAKESSPPIQDITTDTENPPTFWYAPNPRVYGGFEVSTLQEEYYPDIKPLILPISLDKAYEIAIQVIRNKGWILYDPNREEMHIEATDSTFWFGFSDDIVIHITRTENGFSRVDIRSASRFGGGGDGGTNANRIRSYFKEYKKLAK